MRTTTTRLGALSVAAIAAAVPALACIVIPPVPPHPPHPPQPRYLEVRSQHITLSFEHPVVRARVETTLYNPHPTAVEGTFLFPLPAGASVTKFVLYVNGKPVKGEILPAEKARDAYLSIVRRLKDPALLEYANMGLFKARLFPVPAGKTTKISLEYLQTLPVNDNLVRFFHNVRIGRSNPPSKGELVVEGRIHSAVPIKPVFSPTHEIDVVRVDDHKVKFSLELTDHPYDRDFILYYGVAKAPLGFHALTHRSPGEDGYFMLLLAPPVPKQQEVPPKDIIFVIDTSGSMRGKKIEQAREALVYALDSLKAADRFAIVAFATAPRSFADQLVEAKPAQVKKAKAWVRALDAAGGTDINAALLEACKIAGTAASDRPSYVLMVTDGRPTYGVRDIGKIVENVTEANGGQDKPRSRLFILGVGYDVNTHLLDLLAEHNAGTTGYVRPDEDLEMAISSLVDKIGSPVLTDLKLSVRGAAIADVHPTRPRDLFKGEQLSVVGRYSKPGSATVRLTGRLGSGPQQTWRWKLKLPRRNKANSFLPRLWATRHIGYLLDEIRLHGPNEELKKEIVRLALKFGIVTPYTSYLVAEEHEHIAAGANVGWRAATAPGMPGGPAGAFGPPAPSARREAAAGLGGAATGRVAVDAAKAVQRMKQAGAVPPAAPAGARGKPAPATVKYAGGKTFYYDAATGYWVDADYRADLREVRVQYLGRVYFELAKRRPDIAQWLAVGQKVKIALGNVGLVIAPDVQDTLSIDEIERLGAS